MLWTFFHVVILSTYVKKPWKKPFFWPIKPCISPLSRKMHTLKMLFLLVFYPKYFGTFFLLIRHITTTKRRPYLLNKIHKHNIKTTRSGSHSLGWVNFFLDFYQTHATGAYYNSENLTHPTHATFQAFYMQAGTGLTSFLLSSTLLSLVKLTPFFFLLER